VAIAICRRGRERRAPVGDAREESSRYRDPGEVSPASTRYSGQQGRHNDADEWPQRAPPAPNVSGEEHAAQRRSEQKAGALKDGARQCIEGSKDTDAIAT